MQAMNSIAAIWHHPGTPPNRQGAGDYPVVIISFVNAPPQTPGVAVWGVVVDATRHVNVAPITELEIVDAEVRAALAGVPATGA
jgi:hypothetical protein